MTTSSRVVQTRLKSSFIYLANAVNDLRGNWKVLAAVIAPLVLAASLCLLPDALNLQHRVVQTFEAAGGQAISLTPAQMPIHPDRPEPLPLYPLWFTRTLHLLSLVILFTMKLVVLCMLRRARDNARAPDTIVEGIAIYRDAIELVPAFALVVVLQWLATAVGLSLLFVPGLLVYVWLFFAQYSVVFDGSRSWHALLFSRELMRGRFPAVATRIMVFLAMWSGYNSWTATIFVGISLLLGRVVVTTSIAATIFILDLFAVAAVYTIAAFFFAASLRLYQDLCAIAAERAPAKTPGPPPTVPLGSASS